MNRSTERLLNDCGVAFTLLSTPACNEVLLECARDDLPALATYLAANGAALATMTGLDLTQGGAEFAVEFVFSLSAVDEFVRVRAAVPVSDPQYPSVTTVLPAAQWYEREVKDLLGIIPTDHPDPRRLVLHETWPHGYHPLRKNVSATEHPPLDHRRFDYFEVHGEGIYELPVGPIHAGIIEPGHFRFSNAGELILRLDARLFYTHRGIEKLVEGRTFEDALFLVERTCGVCTVSHAVSFSSAVERLAGAELTPRAVWLRTLLLELERLYNHIGDIGNICAGAGFHFGVSQGAILKERLQRANEALTGHRFLMGLVGIGGLRYDLDDRALEACRSTLSSVRTDFEGYVDTVLNTGSFVTRITGAGVLDHETALALGGTGVAARASGSASDYRRDHPHLAYGQLALESHKREEGDVGARLRLRADEAITSFRLADDLIAGMPSGSVMTPLPDATPGESALGYSESPRGSNVHWLMAGPGGRVDRLRIRSASFANWPLVTRAVVGNMVPDFPLINKSFELCYACCDR